MLTDGSVLSKRVLTVYGFFAVCSTGRPCNDYYKLVSVLCFVNNNIQNHV